MYHIARLCITILLLFTVNSAYSEETSGGAENAAQSAVSDSRQLVAMPDQVRQVFRQEMLDHLSALNEIIANLATNNLTAAADIAETRMGKSSMGKHRGTDTAPGRYMPVEMRSLGWGMHEAASELAELAKKEDLAGAYSALQKITASCVACHYSYRTQ